MNGMIEPVSSWGNLSRPLHRLSMPAYADEIPPALSELIAATGSVLAYGMGRSYGDSCLNDGGGLVMTRRLDRCLSFDQKTGLLRAEAGMTIEALNRLTMPRNWFVAVTPGTRFVTLGGAVANDVHGKNHHLAGSFGHHLRRIGLRRSDGTLIECSPECEEDLFRATIGGLGLTGLIEWVEIALIPIVSSMIEVENIRFPHLDAFFELAEDSAAWPYSVAWVDCLARGRRLGRGIFSRGRHSEIEGACASPRRHALTVPATPPFSLVNRASVTLFNEIYWLRPGASFKGRSSCDSFFYPLDGIGRWNRVYGPRGFHQYQCVLPPEGARSGTSRLLEKIAASGQGSCLVVLKRLGDRPSPGMLSFPMPGFTLALDFPNRGKDTLALMSALDETVAECGGRLYPAKDARMSPALFAAGYPGLGAFKRYIDPAFTSDFSRRVLGG